MGYECLGEGERTEMVRGEGCVPSLYVGAWLDRHDAGVVEDTADRQVQRHDLGGGAANAGDVREVGDHGNGLAAL